MKTIVEQLCDDLSVGIQAELDNKIEEALRLWGVDPTSLSELSTRAAIMHPHIPDNAPDTFIKDPYTYLYIDSKMVMFWTQPEFEDTNFTEDYRYGCSFKCSEILKPQDEEETNR